MRHNFTDSGTISRKVKNGYSTTYAEVTTIPCHIQPMTDSFAQGEMGRDSTYFRMFSTGEVRIGDRIEDQNGKTYEATDANLLSFRSRTFYRSKLRAI